MLVLKSHLVGASIMGLHTVAKLAEVESIVVDPRHLKITAFYCKGKKLDYYPAVLGANDVREYDKKYGLIIDSANEIVSPDDMVRLQEILNFNFDISKVNVVDDLGRKIGKVVDYVVETRTFYIIKLHVNPGLIKSIISDEVIIDRNQIIDVTNENIVVKSATERSAESSKKELVKNPFKHRTQPETITTKN